MGRTFQIFFNQELQCIFFVIYYAKHLNDKIYLKFNYLSM